MEFDCLDQKISQKFLLMNICKLFCFYLTIIILGLNMKCSNF